MNAATVYWANICILNRMERDLLEKASAAFAGTGKPSPRVVYLGDTEEVRMYERMDLDLAEGRLGFDLIVSTRFDLFAWKKYLLGRRDELLPLRRRFPVRKDFEAIGVLDPFGLFHPLAVLPHYIVVNTQALGGRRSPESLRDLLDPDLAGSVFIGDTELPSGKAVLLALWFLFGDEGLEICVRNWRRKSAPSGARHAVLKGEAAVGVLPGVFSGPGPRDELAGVVPSDGVPVLPSYCAVRKGPGAEAAASFLASSAASKDFLEFYREKAFAYASLESVEPPESEGPLGKLFFPDWDWILKQDMDRFHDACLRMPKI